MFYHTKRNGGRRVDGALAKGVVRRHFGKEPALEDPEKIDVIHLVDSGARKAVALSDRTSPPSLEAPRVLRRPFEVTGIRGSPAGDGLVVTSPPDAYAHAESSR